MRAIKRTSIPLRTVSSSGPELNVEDFLTLQLSRLSKLMRVRLTKPLLEEHRLSLPEWRLLSQVARRPEMRISELVAHSGMDKGQVSRTVRAMTTRGLTKIKAIDTSPSRSSVAMPTPVMVSITAKGTTLYNEMLPAARTAQANLLRKLNKSERVALYAIIDKLLVTMGDGNTIEREHN